ncbi:hypothetical protein BU15DRAFT_65043 [Melanogaster broomeanus]|nr:hypothetical protein BU15DRAFT_65043 [Melanogaster broomeanus]
MYCNLDEVIKICLLLEDEASDSDDDNAEDEKAKAAHRRVLQKVPFQRPRGDQKTPTCLRVLERYLMSLLRKKSEREKFNSLLNDAISRTREDDASHLNPVIGSYAAPQPDRKVIDPPINPKASKDRLGFSHPELTKLLCPVRQLQTLLEDPVEARLQSRTDRGGFSPGILGRAGSQAHFHIAILHARGDYDSNDHEDDLVLMKRQVAAWRARLASSPDPPAQAIVGSPLCHTPSSPAAPLTPLPPSSPLVQPRRSPPPHAPPPRNVPKGKREQMEDVPDHWDTGSPLSEAPNGDTENDIQQPQPKRKTTWRPQGDFQR